MASKRPFIFLDANVLYSPRIRELFFFYCAVAGATPFWSVKIVEEWKNNYLQNTSPANKKQIKTNLKNAHERMKSDYPKSEINLSKKEINAVNFPRDLDDRHVIAAANKHKVDYVVTNDKDLKGSVIDGITYISVKDFFDSPENDIFLKEAIMLHVKTLNKPKVTLKEYMKFLKNNLG